MTKLLQKEAKFNWTSDCEAAFQQLMTLLTTTPVLTQPNVTKLFDVYCDAPVWGMLPRDTHEEAQGVLARTGWAGPIKHRRSSSGLFATRDYRKLPAE